MRVFSLEYIRQCLNSDQVNLLANKKKNSFKLKKEVGPFIVKDKPALPKAEERIKEMGLELTKSWNYDPHGIITTIRKTYDLFPYPHQSKSDIEKLANLESWEDV